VVRNLYSAFTIDSSTPTYFEVKFKKAPDIIYYSLSTFFKFFYTTHTISQEEEYTRSTVTGTNCSPLIHKMYFLYARVVGTQVVGENTSLFRQWRPHHRTFRHSSEMTTFWSSSFLPNQKQFFTFCSGSPRPVLARIFPVTVTHNYVSSDVVGGRNRTTAYKANPRISTAAPHRTEEYLFICPCFLHIALLHWKKHFRRLSFGGERTGLHTKSSIMTNNLNGRTAFAPFLRVLWNVPGQCPLLRPPIKNGVATHMVNICVCLV
jgi:hypothetical protein